MAYVEEAGHGRLLTGTALAHSNHRCRIRELTHALVFGTICNALGLFDRSLARGMQTIKLR